MLTYLEPRHILFVVPPRLLLQLSCSEVLLVRPLLVVEDQEQRICVELVEHVWLLECSSGLARKRHWRSVGVTRSIPEKKGYRTEEESVHAEGWSVATWERQRVLANTTVDIGCTYVALRFRCRGAAVVYS